MRKIFSLKMLLSFVFFFALAVEANAQSQVFVSATTIVNSETAINAVNGGAIISRRNNTVEGNTNNGVFSGFFSAK
jgi:hypothetical protein